MHELSSAYCAKCDKHFTTSTKRCIHDRQKHNFIQPLNNISNAEFIKQFGHLETVSSKICHHCSKILYSKRACIKHVTNSHLNKENAAVETGQEELRAEPNIYASCVIHWYTK